MFNPGDKVQVMDIANVRRTPGNVNKDNWDVFSSVQPGQILTVVSGPHEVDGLVWFEVDLGAENGFVVESVNGEIVLAAHDGSFDGAGGFSICRPMSHQFPVSQWWGENPEFYSQIQGYPVPLQGHNGIDFACAIGSPVVSVDAGTVERARWDDYGFGNLLVIRHGWGKSYYAHLDGFSVAEGQPVGRGEHVAQSGNTGLGTGPHLHFSIKINGQDDRANGWGGFSDPTPYAEDQW